MSLRGPASIPDKVMGKATFDYVPTAANQLALKKGSVIVITTKGEAGGWSKGIDEYGEINSFEFL